MRPAVMMQGGCTGLTEAARRTMGKSARIQNLAAVCYIRVTDDFSSAAMIYSWPKALKRDFLYFSSRTTNADYFPRNLADTHAVCLEYFHDFCLVRPFAVQGEPTGLRDHGQFEHRAVRILAGGAGQSLWKRGLFTGATQDHSGSHYADRVCGVFGVLSQGAAGLESSGRLCLHCGRRILHLP